MAADAGLPVSPSCLTNFPELNSSQQRTKSQHICPICCRGLRVGIKCDRCNLWYHFRCSLIDKTKADTIANWECYQCIISSKDQLLHHMQLENATLQQQVSQCQKKLDDALNTIISLNASLTLDADRQCSQSHASSPAKRSPCSAASHVPHSFNKEKVANVNLNMNSPSQTPHINLSSTHRRGARLPSLPQASQANLSYSFDVRSSLPHRLTTYDTLSSATGSPVYVFGDSYLRHVTSDFFQTHCYPGIRINSLYHIISSIVPNGVPNQIVIHAGSNNLATTRNADYIMGDLYELILKLQTLYPSSTFTICGIPYRRDVTDRRIDLINGLFRWVALSLKTKYFCINSQLTLRDYSYDGIHFNRLGNSKFRDHFAVYLRQTSGSVSGFPPQCSQFPPLHVTKMRPTDHNNNKTPTAPSSLTNPISIPPCPPGDEFTPTEPIATLQVMPAINSTRVMDIDIVTSRSAANVPLVQTYADSVIQSKSDPSATNITTATFVSEESRYAAQASSLTPSYSTSVQDSTCSLHLTHNDNSVQFCSNITTHPNSTTIGTNHILNTQSLPSITNDIPKN